MKNVIIIVLVLATVWFLYSIMSYIYGSKAGLKTDSLQAKMATVKSAIDEYYRNTGQYPKTLDDLLFSPAELKDKWAGPYLKSSSLRDFWKNMYIYEPNNTNPANYNITSYGADGKPGGKGESRDISLLGFAEQWNLAKAEQKAVEQKEHLIKTTIPRCLVLFLWVIAIYKYTTRPKTMHNSQ
jgi:general secretion pathway protein G